MTKQTEEEAKKQAIEGTMSVVDALTQHRKDKSEIEVRAIRDTQREYLESKMRF